MRYHWLLDVQIDGVTYRWTSAPQGVEVETEAGDTLTYDAGLDDMRQSQGEPAGVDVSDESVDWPTLVLELQGRPAALRRWLEGDPWERAEVYSTGLAVGVSHDVRSVRFRIEQPAGPPTLGTQMPDPLARIDTDTFPTALATNLGTDEGAWYPILLGLPGWIPEGGPAQVQCMPVPLAQWDATDDDTWVVVADDGSQPVTQCVVLNETTGVALAQDVKAVTDNLGRSILVADFGRNPTVKPSAADQRDRLFASFFPSHSAAVRDAYDVIVYLLRRFGPLTVDWRRLPEVRQLLEGYLVDCWISDPVPDPWVWIEELTADLPVEVRVGQQGRYLVPSRYLLESARVVRSLAAGEDVERDSAVELTEPTNEFVGLFRQGPVDDEWISSVVLTGAVGEVLSAPHVVAPDTRVVTSRRCRASVSRFGLRPAPTPVTIDWTWDLGTMVRVLEHRAARDALPSQVVTYVGDESLQLREGEHIELTDDELGLDAALAIVDAPPEVGPDGIEVVLRVPT